MVWQNDFWGIAERGFAIVSNRRRASIQTRGIYARTNHANGGFKDNTPDGWVDTNGPVWWYGNDSAWIGKQPAGRSSITKATSIIVNRLAAAKWSVNKGVSPRWITDPMLTRPDERFPDPIWPAALRLPQSYFWGQLIRSALLQGMGYLLFQENSQGLPIPGTMAILNPASVDSSNYNESGVRRISSQYENVTLDRENRFRLGNSTMRVVELRNPLTPINPETGTTPGVIEHHAAELGILNDIISYSGQTFGQSGVPSGYLKVDSPQLTQAHADALKSQWMNAHGTGKRSVAVLNATTSYQPISVTPADAGLVEMKRLSLVDVANAFCVPLYMLGAPTGDSMTYSNLQMEWQALWAHTLWPWAVAIEQTISCLLPYGTDLTIEDPFLTANNGQVNNAGDNGQSIESGTIQEVNA